MIQGDKDINSEFLVWRYGRVNEATGRFDTPNKLAETYKSSDPELAEYRTLLHSVPVSQALGRYFRGLKLAGVVQARAEAPYAMVEPVHKSDIHKKVVRQAFSGFEDPYSKFSRVFPMRVNVDVFKFLTADIRSIGRKTVKHKDSLATFMAGLLTAPLARGTENVTLNAPASEAVKLSQAYFNFFGLDLGEIRPVGEDKTLIIMMDMEGVLSDLQRNKAIRTLPFDPFELKEAA